MSYLYFDKIAKSYDKWYETKVGKYVDSIEKEIVFSFFSLQKGKILDLGCGTGNYTSELKKRGFEVIGLDLSKEMLKIAKQKNSSLLYLRGDAYHLPFKEETFDGVLSITMFEFIEKPKEVMKEIYRVLKPGGELVIGTMNGRSLWFLFKRLKSLFKETAYRYARFYTPSELESLLKELNFKNIQTAGVIFFPSFFPFLELAKKIDRKLCSKLKNFGAFILARGIKNEKRFG